MFPLFPFSRNLYFIKFIFKMTILSEDLTIKHCYLKYKCILIPLIIKYYYLIYKCMIIPLTIKHCYLIYKVMMIPITCLQNVLFLPSFTIKNYRLLVFFWYMLYELYSSKEVNPRSNLPLKLFC